MNLPFQSYFADDDEMLAKQKGNAANQGYQSRINVQRKKFLTPQTKMLSSAPQQIAARDRGGSRDDGVSR